MKIGSVSEDAQICGVVKFGSSKPLWVAVLLPQSLLTQIDRANAIWYEGTTEDGKHCLILTDVDL